MDNYECFSYFINKYVRFFLALMIKRDYGFHVIIPFHFRSGFILSSMNCYDCHFKTMLYVSTWQNYGI